MITLKTLEDRRVCGNCAHGRFEMTGHNPPRFRKEEGFVVPGECRYDVATVFEEYKSKLPLAAFLGYLRLVPPNMNHGLEPDDCEGCPCWAERRS